MSNTGTTKITCTKCKIEKPPSEFYNSTIQYARKDGRTTRLKTVNCCKKCHTEKVKKSRQKNKKFYEQYWKKYFKKNEKRIKAYQKEYFRKLYEKNKEEIKQKNLAYYHLNKAKKKADDNK